MMTIARVDCGRENANKRERTRQRANSCARLCFTPTHGEGLWGWGIKRKHALAVLEFPFLHRLGSARRRARARERKTGRAAVARHQTTTCAGIGMCVTACSEIYRLYGMLGTGSTGRAGGWSVGGWVMKCKRVRAVRRTRKERKREWPKLEAQEFGAHKQRSGVCHILPITTAPSKTTGK